MSDAGNAGTGPAGEGAGYDPNDNPDDRPDTERRSWTDRLGERRERRGVTRATVGRKRLVGPFTATIGTVAAVLGGFAGCAGAASDNDLPQGSGSTVVRNVDGPNPGCVIPNQSSLGERAESGKCEPRVDRRDTQGSEARELNGSARSVYNGPLGNSWSARSGKSKNPTTDISPSTGRELSAPSLTGA